MPRYAVLDLTTVNWQKHFGSILNHLPFPCHPPHSICSTTTCPVDIPIAAGRDSVFPCKHATLTTHCLYAGLGRRFPFTPVVLAHWFLPVITVNYRRQFALLHPPGIPLHTTTENRPTLPSTFHWCCLYCWFRLPLIRPSYIPPAAARRIPLPTPSVR